MIFHRGKWRDTREARHRFRRSYLAEDRKQMWT